MKFQSIVFRLHFRARFPTYLKLTVKLTVPRLTRQTSNGLIFIYRFKLQMGKKSSKRKATPKTIDWIRLNDEEREEWNEKLKRKWLVKFSEDFFDVYELALHLKPADFKSKLKDDEIKQILTIIDAFHEILGVQLVGPFEIFDGIADENVPHFMKHRYFYDPPEMTTVMIKSNDPRGQHWGYFRDVPTDDPNYIVESKNAADCELDIASQSLMALLQTMISKRETKLMRSIQLYMETKEIQIIDCVSLRRKEQTAPTRNKMGIVVPVESKSQIGFRQLPLTGDKLYNELDGNGSKINDLLTRVNIATDECDFGTGLQFGMDLFCSEKCHEVKNRPIFDSLANFFRIKPWSY